MLFEGDDDAATPKEPVRKARRVSRRTLTVNADVTGDTPPVLAEEPVVIQAAAPVELRTPYVQRNFFYALMLGAAFALTGTIDSQWTSWLGLIGPIAMIVGFYVFGVKQGWPTHSDSRQRFADACYFLGFLFTMWALMVGFIPAGLGLTPLGSTDILRHFGMALGATAAGLICRILVLQAAGAGDDAAQVEADLHAYAIRITEEARTIAGHLAATRDQVIETQRATLDALTTQFDKTLIDMAMRLAGAAQTIETALNASASKAQEASGQFTLAVTASDAAVRQQAQETVAAHQESAAIVTDVAQALVGLKTAMGDTQQAMTGAMQGATAQMRGLTDALQTDGQQVERIHSALGQMDARMASANEQIAQLEVTAEQSREALAQRAHDAGTLREEVARQLAQEREQLQAVLAEDRGRFAQEMGVATQELARIVESFTAELQRLRTQPVPS